MNSAERSQGEKSFWETLPGLLTALAALVTAIGGCMAVIVTLPKPNIFFPATEVVSSTPPPGITQVLPTTPPPADGQVTPATSTSISPTPVALRKTFFNLPNDGVRNNNGYIGPFCCTGRTATVFTTGDSPIGYIYFFEFPGGGYIVSNGSVAANFSILISGITDLANMDSPSQQSAIDFTAPEMKVGASRSARAGVLNYTVTISHVDITSFNNEPYYDMGTIDVRVDVTLLP